HRFPIIVSSHHTLSFFFFHDPSTTEIYTLSLHDALPICGSGRRKAMNSSWLALTLLTAATLGAQTAPAVKAHESAAAIPSYKERSEEHTSELQSRFDLVCRLLLEKKKKKKKEKKYKEKD